MIERTVDLCIVGSAGAGLSAAVKAKELGVKDVLVIEKQASTGGCSKMPCGLFAVDSPVQKRLGFYYNPDTFYKELMKVTGWNCDAWLVRKWITGSGETIRWLESYGMQFDAVRPGNGVEGKAASTYHFTRQKGYHTGANIVKTLMDACEKFGVEFMLNTRARHLIRKDNGPVTGVIAETKDGEEVIIHAKAVILGTGSISSNKDLIRRFYNGEGYENIRIMAAIPHNTGDGLIMAEEIGASDAPISTLFIGPHNHFPGASECVGSLIRRPQPVRVNRLGERCHDESWIVNNDFGWMIGVNLDRQPGKVIYGILNKALIDDWQKNSRRPFHAMEELTTQYTKMRAPDVLDHDIDYGTWLDNIYEELDKEIAGGRAAKCETYEEIAAYIGCDPAVLTKTMNDYNHYCDIGYDAQFLKDPDYLVPFNKPPYYVLRGPSGIDTCLGGLLINHRQEVLDKEQYAIPGLYAAGVMTSGWTQRGGYAYFGAELSYTLFSGRNAGAEATEYIGKFAE